MAELCFEAGAMGDIIRQQYLAAPVVQRWGSGHGVYTDFEIVEPVTRLPADTPPTFGQAAFEMFGVGHSDYDIDGYGTMMCHLHQADGIIYCLECCGYHGTWPTDQYIWREYGYSRRGRSGNA